MLLTWMIFYLAESKRRQHKEGKKAKEKELSAQGSSLEEEEEESFNKRDHSPVGGREYLGAVGTTDKHASGSRILRRNKQNNFQ